MTTPDRLSRRALLITIFERQELLMAKIDELRDEVAANKTVTESAITLIQGISTRLDNAVAEAKAGNDTALAQLQSDLKNEDDALAAAVAANTPSAPPPAPAGAQRP